MQVIKPKKGNDLGVFYEVWDGTTAPDGSGITFLGTMQEFQFEESADENVYDLLGSESGDWEQSSSGKKRWTGSMNGLVTKWASDSIVKTMHDIFAAGDYVDIYVAEVNRTATPAPDMSAGKLYFKGTCWIPSNSLPIQAGADMTLSVSLKGTGEPTLDVGPEA
ncbi:hypothetical protein V6R21_20145 [Limibacter armeniacum]|uniref:hypothetical protein n=1 Tax=Limibacter armeniacum TaxID=466084 RepID=UPI002FE5B700